MARVFTVVGKHPTRSIQQVICWEKLTAVAAAFDMSVSSNHACRLEDKMQAIDKLRHGLKLDEPESDEDFSVMYYIIHNAVEFRLVPLPQITELEDCSWMIVSQKKVID